MLRADQIVLGEAERKAALWSLHLAATYDDWGAASELLESGAAIIIPKEYDRGLREMLMAGAVAVGSKEKSKKGKGCRA